VPHDVGRVGGTFPLRVQLAGTDSGQSSAQFNV